MNVWQPSVARGGWLPALFIPSNPYSIRFLPLPYGVVAQGVWSARATEPDTWSESEPARTPRWSAEHHARWKSDVLLSRARSVRAC